MKQFIRLILASTLLVPAVFAAAAFEGKVTFKITSGRDKPQEMTYSIKGDKIRMEMGGQKEMGGMIVDTTKKEMLMLMTEQKMYMVMAMPESAMEKAQKQADDVKLEKTNEHEKILGHPATKYIATDSKGVSTDLWLAEGLGSFMAMRNENPMARGRSGSTQKGWERALAGKELFPLRVVGKDKAGKEDYRMEVTAIDKKSLPDSDFTPPADFQKFDMGAMMKGMIPGR
jgi:hypothetical protein